MIAMEGRTVKPGKSWYQLTLCKIEDLVPETFGQYPQIGKEKIILNLRHITSFSHS